MADIQKKPLIGFTVGVTDTFEFVTMNIPPDRDTPNGAVLLFNAEQARNFAGLLLQAAQLCDGGETVH